MKKSVFACLVIMTGVAVSAETEPIDYVNPLIGTGIRGQSCS